MGRKQLLEPDFPTLVCERLKVWGQAIRKQRVAQGMLAVDLCRRIGISHPTLRRLETGEPTIGAAYYLAALHVLGLMDRMIPFPDEALWHMNDGAQRVRQVRSHDDDYF